MAIVPGGGGGGGSASRFGSFRHIKCQNPAVLSRNRRLRSRSDEMETGRCEADEKRLGIIAGKLIERCCDRMLFCQIALSTLFVTEVLRLALRSLIRSSLFTNSLTISVLEASTK